MNEVKWYCRGNMGEWVLDQLESLLGPFALTEEEVVRRLRRYLSEEEARSEVRLFLEEEAV